MTDINSAIAATAPDIKPEMSRMKPNASRTVSRIMPINAKNAALFRVMVEIIRPQIHCQDQDEAHYTTTSGVDADSAAAMG